MTRRTRQIWCRTKEMYVEAGPSDDDVNVWVCHEGACSYRRGVLRPDEDQTVHAGVARLNRLGNVDPKCALIIWGCDTRKIVSPDSDVQGTRVQSRGASRDSGIVEAARNHNDFWGGA